MEFPVVVNSEPMPAECAFARSRDVKQVAGWVRIGELSTEAAIQDAAEFAGLACKRWRFYRKAGRFTNSLEDIRGAITKEPMAELALLLVARSAWGSPSQVLGICLCRRTWSNSLCVDFLAAFWRQIQCRLRALGAACFSLSRKLLRLLERKPFGEKLRSCPLEPTGTCLGTTK
jgi:hypothetical protein